MEHSLLVLIVRLLVGMPLDMVLDTCQGIAVEIGSSVAILGTSVLVARHLDTLPIQQIQERLRIPIKLRILQMEYYFCIMDVRK